MTLPNGPAGLTAAIEWPVQFVGGGLQALTERTQDVVTEVLTAEIQLSTAWNTATQILYEGLERGIPFVLSLLQALIQRLFNTVESFPGVQEALNAIEQVPGVAQVQGLLSAAVDQFDGTAQAVASVVMRADGTAVATFNQYVTAPVTALIDNIDGTVSGLSELIFHGDGTAVFSAPDQPLHSLNPLMSLFDQFDGTVMSVARVMANASIAAHAVGTPVATNLTNAVANVQLGLDAIANALGHFGPGHSPADIFNYLQSFPAGLINGVTAIEQQIIDLINQAFNVLSGTGLAPSSLTSSIQNALGGLLPAVIDNFDGTAGALANIVNNVDGTATYVGQQSSNAVQTLIDNADGTAMSLAAAMNNALAGAQQTGANLISGVAGVWGSIFGALSGAPTPAAATPAQAYAALQNQQAVTANSSANIGGLTGLTVASVNQALQRSVIGSGAGIGGGVYATINFSGYANQSDLTGIFTAVSARYDFDFGSSTTTAIGIQGGTCAWLGPANHGEVAYYATATTSDYQVVSMVLSSLNDIAHTGIVYASNGLLGRCNTAMTTYVGLNIGNGKATLFTSVAGSVTDFWVVAHTAIAGAVYELVLGNSGISNPYSISAYCNGVQIGTTYVDGSHVSQVGSSFRNSGIAMANEGGGLVPASLSSWGVADNAPPTVIGSGFRAYRASTSAGTLVAASPSTWTTGAVSWTVWTLPASAFDTIQWQTSDTTWDSSTNTVTVAIAGWYQVTVSNMVSVSSGGAIAACVFHNGALAQSGTSGIYSAGNGPVMQSTFSIYCAANDTLAPGILESSAGSALQGDTSGVGTYFQVTLANCGTLS